MLYFTERVSTSELTQQELQNIPFFDYSFHLNQDREFFGYADKKIFAYFLNRCNIVAIGNRNLRMTRKRIALSVPPEMEEVLDKISDLTGQPKTKIILEMLEQYVPVLEQTIEALEQIRDNKENALSIVQKFAGDLLLDGNQKLGQIATEVKNLK
ncbi:MULTISPECIES: hypothetical protein [unclassified Acinetobacter]|nr:MULTISPECIES: hypothetical protein [unclassified Acinetobacter]